jgi:hypothetical protein
MQLEIDLPFYYLLSTRVVSLGTWELCTEVTSRARKSGWWDMCNSRHFMSFLRCCSLHYRKTAFIDEIRTQHACTEEDQGEEELSLSFPVLGVSELRGDGA